MQNGSSHTATEHRASTSRVAPPITQSHSPYTGFLAGIISGWTKLCVGYPFDTLKTRLQCAPKGTFKGAGYCLRVTLGNEGPLALYKGAFIPFLTWGLTDSIMMGSLHNYREALKRSDWTEEYGDGSDRRLTLVGHGMAGLFAGWTNALVVHPTEIVKCKLQVSQTTNTHVKYNGPLDVIRQTVRSQGVFGMWRGVGATVIYRSTFGVFAISYEVLNRTFRNLNDTTWAVSTPTANFLSGGTAAAIYWMVALPPDNIRNRIMADSLHQPRYNGVLDAYRQVWREEKGLGRLRNFYRGFVPVVLRAFPANAASFAVWEAVMRTLES